MENQDLVEVANKFGCTTDQWDRLYEIVVDIWDSIKKVITNISENMKDNKNIQLLVKMTTDKELNKYGKIHNRVKSKRLKKKYEKKISKRIEELRELF